MRWKSTAEISCSCGRASRDGFGLPRVLVSNRKPKDKNLDSLKNNPFDRVVSGAAYATRHALVDYFRTASLIQ